MDEKGRSDRGGPALLVTHVGNAPEDAGGISAVVANYLSEGSVQARVLPTYSDRGRVRTLGRFARALAAAGTRPRAALGVVHVHLSWRGSFVREGLVLAVVSARRIPTVATIHGGGFVDWSHRRPLLAALVLRHADSVTVLSRGTADRAAQLGARRVAVVPNSVAVGERVSEVDPRPTVVFAGAASRRKGVDVLLDAWPGVVARVPDARLVLLGPPGDVAIASSDGIVCRGPLTRGEAHRVYETAWVAALPSRAEGLPMFLLEAMAAGCGIVATPVGGIPELVPAEQDTGVLVPVGDPSALTEALATALDPEVARRRGAAARALVRERFGNDAVLARMREVWTEAAEDAAARGGRGIADRP